MRESIRHIGYLDQLPRYGNSAKIQRQCRCYCWEQNSSIFSPNHNALVAVSKGRQAVSSVSYLGVGQYLYNDSKMVVVVSLTDAWFAGCIVCVQCGCPQSVGSKTQFTVGGRVTLWWCGSSQQRRHLIQLHIQLSEQHLHHHHHHTICYFPIAK